MSADHIAPPPPRLQNKVCLITGASSGLGRAIAFAYAHNGAALVVNADLKAEPRPGVDGQVAATHEEICRIWGPGRAKFMQCDVTNSESVKAAVGEAVKIGGRLDVMVNNAGLGTEDRTIRLHELPDEEWERVMRVNSTGVFNGCKHALSQMLNQAPPPPTPPNILSPTPSASARGYIINTSSMLGRVGITDGAGAYCASKGAVLNLTRQLAVDYACDRIHVNALCPGFTKTAMTKGNYEDEEISREMVKTTPWGEWGRAEEVARAAVFLASDDAAFVMGIGLDVDGGYLAQ